MTPTEGQAILVLLAAQTNLLREIRDLLRDGVPSADEEPEPFAPCQHPEEARADFSTPGDRNHWVCTVCQHDNKAVA